MDTYQETMTDRGNAEAKRVQNCGSAPKWAVLVGDLLSPMPRRKLTARVILDQSGRAYVLNEQVSMER